MTRTSRIPGLLIFVSPTWPSERASLFPTPNLLLYIGVDGLVVLESEAAASTDLVVDLVVCCMRIVEFICRAGSHRKLRRHKMRRHNCYLLPRYANPGDEIYFCCL